MERNELMRVRQRARRAYELARVRFALVGIVPIAIVVCVALGFARNPSSSIAFGACATLLGFAMVWHGRGLERRVFLGLAAGLTPLVFALWANQVHMCGAHGCTSLCLPACALGGVVSGLTISAFVSPKKPMSHWISASALALLVGAMGCACMGYSGLVGLGLGFSGGMTSGVFGRALQARR